MLHEGWPGSGGGVSLIVKDLHGVARPPRRFGRCRTLPAWWRSAHAALTEPTADGHGRGKPTTRVPPMPSAITPQAAKMRLIEIVRRRSYGTGVEIKLASGRTSNFYFNMKPTMLDPEGAYLTAALMLDALAGDPATRAAQMKQRLITELKMTDVQADSVVSINMSYRPQMRDIFQDESLSQDEKKAKMKAITDQADKRIQPVLGDPLFKQYQDWRMKNMQQMRSGKAGNS